MEYRTKATTKSKTTADRTPDLVYAATAAATHPWNTFNLFQTRSRAKMESRNQTEKHT